MIVAFFEVDGGGAPAFFGVGEEQLEIASRLKIIMQKNRSCASFFRRGAHSLLNVSIDMNSPG